MNIRPKPPKPRIKKVGTYFECSCSKVASFAESRKDAFEGWKKHVKLLERKNAGYNET